MGTETPLMSSKQCERVMSVCLISALLAGVWILSNGLAPAVASTAADCNWAPDDPAAVVQSCTVQLSLEKAPAAWMYFNRGLAFKVLGRLDDAHRDYTKAIEVDPSFAPAYANRGNVRVLRNDVPGGMADFRKALALDPGDDVTRANFEAIEATLQMVGAKKSHNGVWLGVAP